MVKAIISIIAIVGLALTTLNLALRTDDLNGYMPGSAYVHSEIK